MEIPLHFQADKIGVYEVPCSELCGLGHFQMRTTMQVMSEADFEQWKATPIGQQIMIPRALVSRGNLWNFSFHSHGASRARRFYPEVCLQPRPQGHRHSILLPRTLLGVPGDVALAAHALPHGEPQRSGEMVRRPVAHGSRGWRHDAGTVPLADDHARHHHGVFRADHRAAKRLRQLFPAHPDRRRGHGVSRS